MKYLVNFQLFESKEKRIRPQLSGIVGSKEELSKYDIPDEIKDMMLTWDIMYKSPYSDTFYDSTNITWGHKPDGSLRVSDHWNFYTQDKYHCQTSTPVQNNTHISIGKYDRKSGRYIILKSVQTNVNIAKIKNSIVKRELLRNPELIEKKRLFKKSISDGNVLAKLNYKGKQYDGIVRKYTGGELKIEDKSGNLIFNSNYLELGKKDSLELFDRSGISIENLLKFR